MYMIICVKNHTYVFLMHGANCPSENQCARGLKKSTHYLNLINVFSTLLSKYLMPSSDYWNMNSNNFQENFCVLRYLKFFYFATFFQSFVPPPPVLKGGGEYALIFVVPAAQSSLDLHQTFIF